MTRAPAARAAVGLDLLAIVLSALTLYMVALGARDLWHPNEPTYGEAVLEMAGRGDWAVPYVNGRVFPEKPILYYWLALVSAALLGGVNELTLRVPSAMAGVIAVAFVYGLVLPYAGRGRARLAAALLATTFMVYWGSRSIQMDILVTVTTLGTLLAVSRVLDHGFPQRLGWSLAGVSVGLGVLAKGPVGVISPGIVILLYLLATGRLMALWTPAVAVAAGLGLAVALPWYLLLLVRGEGDFLYEVLFRQNFQRFVAPWDHQAPWWYYLEYVWIDMAPWSWFLPIAAALPRREPEERRLDLLAWVWILGIVLFFSLSQSKRSPYILPIAPAVAILTSGVAERLLAGRLGRARTVVCLALQGLVGVLLLLAGALVHLRVLPAHPDLLLPGSALVVLLVGGGLAILAGLLNPPRARIAVPAAFFSFLLCLYVLASVWILPAVNAYKSARPFCDRVNALVKPDAALASFGLWDWRSSYTFYTRRPIPNLKSREELESFLRNPAEAFLILEEPQLETARSVLGDRAPLARMGIGEKTAYLFSNR